MIILLSWAYKSHAASEKFKFIGYKIDQLERSNMLILLIEQTNNILGKLR